MHRVGGRKLFRGPFSLVAATAASMRPARYDEDTHGMVLGFAGPAAGISVGLPEETHGRPP